MPQSENGSAADAAPWVTDPKYGGMSPASAEKSYRASQRQIELDFASEALAQQSDALGSPKGILQVTTPADWSNEPPQEMKWLVEHRIPAGDVTILTGDGGAGKTEIALQLALALALEAGEWLGAKCDVGPVLFVSAEEPPEEIRRRAERIAATLQGDLKSNRHLYIHFPPLDECAFARVSTKGLLLFTPEFDRLSVWIRSRRPALVVVDAIVAVFDAPNYDRRFVRQFISKLRMLARETGTTFLLLDHPSVSGMQEGSGRTGSTDWNNAVRSRMYLKIEKNVSAARTLEVVKSNRHQAGEKLRLQWDGRTFTPEPDPGSPESIAANEAIDALFIKLLAARIAEGRPVGPSPSANYAPTVFSKDPGAQGVRKGAFIASMDRLLKVGTIFIAETGPPSRRRRHLELRQGYQRPTDRL